MIKKKSIVFVSKGGMLHNDVAALRGENGVTDWGRRVKEGDDGTSEG